MIKIKKGAGRHLPGVIEAIRRYYDDQPYVHGPGFRVQLEASNPRGAGEYYLARSDGELAAALFYDGGSRLLSPVFFTEDLDRHAEIVGRFLEKNRRPVQTILRPSWDLREGRQLLALGRAIGYRPGPPEVLFRLRRERYRAGFAVREEVDGCRVEYRSHETDIDGVLSTLTPLFQLWSGFYRLEGHSAATCRLFTATMDGQKAAILWVLFPDRCREDQNDCYLHWKRLMGRESIFVRSTVTEEYTRGKGIGSSLHRFMLSRLFDGPEAADFSYISTNAENRANIGLLESLGYRRIRICRYHLLRRH